MADETIKETNDQYKDSANLRRRANIHQKYGRAAIGWFQWIAQSAALPDGAAVLDIGCGPGWLWSEAAAEFPDSLRITLADQSQGMVDEALPRVKNLGRFASVTGQVADIQALPFADRSFDAVLACHMLYHVPDPAKALSEVARVLKPGGIIAITTNGRSNMIEMYELGGRAFGGAMADPSGIAYGLDRAETDLAARFDAVVRIDYPSEMVITDGDDIVDTLTSYPPGSAASPEKIDHLRRLIAERMAKGDGKLAVTRESGMVRGVKR